jgi:predicted RNA-binding protein Jag
LQIAKALRILVKNNGTVTKQNTKIKTSYKKISKIISNELLTPLEETRLVIEEIIIPQKMTIDLLPRPSSIRKLQHELITHYQLRGISVGQEPNRRLRIYPK